MNKLSKILFVAMALVLVVVSGTALIVTRAENQTIHAIYLPSIFNPQNYPVDGWVVTDIWVFAGITYFKMVNNGWEMTAMCIEPNVTPPPLQSVCSLNGDIFTCPGWQGSKIIKLVTTPTPTATFTSTPTPTSTWTPTPTFTATSTPTNTPTPTSTSCPLVCPAMNLRVEYPVGTFKYNVSFAQSPSLPMGSVYRMYTGNETKMSFPVNGAVTAKIICSNGTYNLSTACADGSCKFGCPDFGYSQTECTVKVQQLITTACGTITCQAGFKIIDPIEDTLRFSLPEALPEVEENK